MIINSLKLENFGLYEGKQTFNLKPTKNKNIILIGGKNGNGKTTFFEAIRLCLYGDKIIERSYKKAIYENYLLSKIHKKRSSKNNPKNASVEVEFQHSSLGSVDIYRIRRFWEKKEGGVIEQFEVKKNDKILDELDKEQWQDFVNELIPPGLSKLFFFDGEKIQNLAQDIDDDKQLADSFKSLLGMDLIEKLKSDLEIYSIKEIKETGSEILATEIENLKVEVEKYELELDGLFQEKARINSEIDKISMDIERSELLINQEGGSFAKKREELKLEKIRVSSEIMNIEGQIRELCGGLIPFIFSRKLNLSLKKSLQLEENIRNNEVARKNILAQLSDLEKEPLGELKKISINSKELRVIINWISKKINDKLIYKNDKFPQVHKLSKEDNDRVIALIDIIEEEKMHKLDSLSNNYESLSKLLHNIERDLAYAPEEITIAPYLKQIKILHNKLGSSQQEMKHLGEKFSLININKQKCEGLLKRRIEELSNKKGISKRIQLVNKVQKVLDNYYNHLKDKKIEEFSNLFIESFNEIAQKKEILYSIKVNTNTYETTLYGIDGEKILKAELSAGEKQIYAIAVLWTLTKISKRPLPFIIDTPLGRLDSTHRDNIVFNFFPHASHQIIILSTDTEIDKKYLKSLEPYISKKILLNFDKGGTIIEEGYFWGGEMKYFTRFKASKEATLRLMQLKSRTGLTPNILCRIALCYSLSKSKTSKLAPIDETGQEYSRSTLFGEYDLFYVSLIKQKCIQEGLDPEKDFMNQLKLHINSGVFALHSRIKNLSDFQNLLNE